MITSKKLSNNISTSPGQIAWRFFFVSVWSLCLFVFEDTVCNGTAGFERGQQSLEYQNYLFLKTSGGRNSNLYFNAVHFFNITVT
jgi:hypothetical protein